MRANHNHVSSGVQATLCLKLSFIMGRKLGMKLTSSSKAMRVPTILKSAAMSQFGRSRRMNNKARLEYSEQSGADFQECYDSEFYALLCSGAGSGWQI